MDFTSRHGQPVSAERADALAARSASSTGLVKTTVRDGVMYGWNLSNYLARQGLLHL
jgi:hypothetical protein